MEREFQYPKVTEITSFPEPVVTPNTLIDDEEDWVDWPQKLAANLGLGVVDGHELSTLEDFVSESHAPNYTKLPPLSPMHVLIELEPRVVYDLNKYGASGYERGM